MEALPGGGGENLVFEIIPLDFIFSIYYHGL